MSDTANRHRCACCGKGTTVNYLQRLQQCQACGNYFYFNSKEPWPFARNLQTGQVGAEQFAMESAALQVYRKESERHTAVMEELEPHLERVSLTSKILMLTIIVQISCAFFLAGQLNLHDFTQLPVIILIVLFALTVLLIVQQLFSSEKLKNRREKQRNQFNTIVADLLEIQLSLDLAHVATSNYLREK